MPARPGASEGMPVSVLTRAVPLVGLALALVLGAGLRLLWAQDMEYKKDERWTYHRPRGGGVPEPLPLQGMPTSLGPDNPGLSVWVFVGLGRLAAVEGPVGLARCVGVLNVAGLVLFAAMAFWLVPRPEREPWLWSAALLALNPLAVVFQRKIWPPSVLPPLTLLMLLGWWCRGRRAGAFLWGLVGPCLGQIHVAGHFLAAGFVGWTALRRREGARWGWWLAGAILGAAAMLPWLGYLLRTPEERGAAGVRWVHLF